MKLEYALLHNDLDQIRTRSRRNKKAPFQILTAIFKFKAGSRLPIKQPNESKFAQSFGLLIANYCASCDKTRKKCLERHVYPRLVFFLKYKHILKILGLNSSQAPTPTLALNFKTVITLTPPTVGRPSADKMPDFSSFFIGRQK